MAWRLRMKLRKAPAGVELLTAKLEEFEQRAREVQNAPLDDKRRNELCWPVYKLHFEKSRYVHDMHHKHGRISKRLVDYLAQERIVDGKLLAKWRKPGYERLCSLAAITRSNTNFRTVSVCRTPLRHRTGQIVPNVMTGCVSCASGDGGPVWWDDPVPEIVRRRIAAVDPGKRELVGEGADVLERAKRMREGMGGEVGRTEADEVEEDAEILLRAKRLRESTAETGSVERAASSADEEEKEIENRAKRLKASLSTSTAQDVREASEGDQPGSTV